MDAGALELNGHVGDHSVVLKFSEDKFLKIEVGFEFTGCSWINNCNYL